MLLLDRLIVALLAEGVDRNDILWAEISKWLRVALLAEGVDRNFVDCFAGNTRKCVALLAEGVDRNNDGAGQGAQLVRRPPRGGRG